MEKIYDNCVPYLSRKDVLKATERMERQMEPWTVADHPYNEDDEGLCFFSAYVWDTIVSWLTDSDDEVCFLLPAPKPFDLFRRIRSGLCFSGLHAHMRVQQRAAEIQILIPHSYSKKRNSVYHQIVRKKVQSLVPHMGCRIGNHGGAVIIFSVDDKEEMKVRLRVRALLVKSYGS